MHIVCRQYDLPTRCVVYFLSLSFLCRLFYTLPTDSLLIGFFVIDNLFHYLNNTLLFGTKVHCSVALLCELPQFYTNLRNLTFAMNEKNGIGEFSRELYQFECNDN